MSAHRTPERWLLHGNICQNVEFVALAKLCLARLGKPVTLDEEALQRWIGRICAELPGLESYRYPPKDKPLVCRGINHLAATLCRRYEAEEAIRGRPVHAQPRYPKRAAWLQEILNSRGDTAHRFASLSGIEHRTLKKLLAGRTVQDAVLDRLAAEAGCHSREIPSD